MLLLSPWAVSRICISSERGLIISEPRISKYRAGCAVYRFDFKLESILLIIGGSL